MNAPAGSPSSARRRAHPWRDLSDRLCSLGIGQFFGLYLVVLVGLCLASHIVMGLRGQTFDLFDNLLWWAVSFVLLAYGRLGRPLLTSIRFGGLTIHALTFIVVNGSFALHAYGLALWNGRIDGGIALDPSWFGPLLGMPAFWSVLFVGHAVLAFSVSWRTPAPLLD